MLPRIKMMMRVKVVSLKRSVLFHSVRNVRGPFSSIVVVRLPGIFYEGDHHGQKLLSGWQNLIYLYPLRAFIYFRGRDRSPLDMSLLLGKQENQGSIPCEGNYPFVPFCSHSMSHNKKTQSI